MIALAVGALAFGLAAGATSMALAAAAQTELVAACTAIGIACTAATIGTATTSTAAIVVNGTDPAVKSAQSFGSACPSQSRAASIPTLSIFTASSFLQKQ